VGTSCKSEWGAEDMIGNLSEWTSDWGTSPGDLSVPIAVTPWPNSGGDVGLYGADATFNIQSTVYGAFGDTGTMGLPAALNRGGHWDMGTQAGLFMIGADTAPSNGNAYIGLRCVIFR
jgi:formylglycine-generating enzyme required for sulfatase activity